MTKPFNDIPLSRELRAEVLRDLRRIPEWADYVLKRGWTRRTHLLRGDEIRQACHDLDYRLECASFVSKPSARNPRA